MRIITVNLPVSYLKAVDNLVGDKTLYPSRSELIRVAVRDFLIRELEGVQRFASYTQQQMHVPEPVPVQPDIDSNLFVQVPFGNNADGCPEFKTFRIVKK